MKHGSDDVRKMVIDGYKNGKFTQTEASRVTGYSRVTIGKWCRNEEYTAKPRGHRAAAFSEEELTQAIENASKDVAIHLKKKETPYNMHHLEIDKSLTLIGPA